MESILSEERWARLIEAVGRVDDANAAKEEEKTMDINQFLVKLEKQCPNFHLWCTHNNQYHWKAKSGRNQWEYSDEPFDTAEEALLDFLSQVIRFTLERNG